MITREFDYIADKFDPDQSVQMATLKWSSVCSDGYYHLHSLRMEHHSGDGFEFARRIAFAIMDYEFSSSVCKMRTCYHNGNFYAVFVIDAIDVLES